jgi:hypothetical protein
MISSSSEASSASAMPLARNDFVIKSFQILSRKSLRDPSKRKIKPYCFRAFVIHSQASMKVGAFSAFCLATHVLLIYEIYVTKSMNDMLVISDMLVITDTLKD